jgi:hypothetical protein
MPVTGSSVPRNTGNAGCLLPMGVLFSLGGVVFGLSALLGAKGYEDLTQKMMGGGVAFAVACIGAGLIAAGVSANKAAKRMQDMSTREPGKPWMWRDDWAQGYAKPDWQSEAATRGGIGALLLLTSSASLAGVILHPPRHQSYLTLLVLVLPLTGLVLIGHSILMRLREHKFKQVRLMFSSIPGVIGGRLQGRMETVFPFPSGSDLHMTLSCVRSRVTNSGTSHSRWESVVWQAKRAAVPYAGTPASSVPVDFTVPYDAPETDGSNPDNEVFWRLTANASLPGLDFRACFRVPVFKTASSDPGITVEAIDTAETTHLAGAKPDNAKVKIGTSPEGGVQFHLGPARNRGMAAAFTLFAIVFLGAGIFWGRLVSDSYTRFAGAVPLFICGVVGLGLLLLALSLWFGQTDIQVVNRSLRILSSCLGFSRSRSVNAAEIKKFELYPAMQQGDNVWYDLRLHLSNGGKITAGSGLEKSEAEWFQAELKKDLGL